MTSNQSTQLVKNPNTKKAIMVLQKFAKMEAEYKALEKESKLARDQLKEAMIEAGIPKIEDIDIPGWTGFITLAERTNYSAEDVSKVDAKYLKSALDTTKVKAEAVLTGTLPVGVTESKTQYIIPKFREVL